MATQQETWDATMGDTVKVIPNSNPTGNPALIITSPRRWAKLVGQVGQQRAEAMALRTLRRG